MSVTITPRNREYPPYTVTNGTSIQLVDGGSVEITDGTNILAIVAQSDNDVYIN